MDFRHEYKFVLSISQSLILRERIAGIMDRDDNIGASGSYEIRSIYFDDYDNRCYMQNEAGTDPRSKYRIRSYNASDDRIVLEKKIKQNGMTRKQQQILTKEQYHMLLTASGAEIGMCFHENPPLVQELLACRQLRQLEPKVIVVYERTPFIEPAGNVRVTFDDGISSAKDLDGFFEPELHRRPVMPAGKTLMEVKFDEFLPSYIKEALEIGRLTQTTFSKYYLCRRYSL